MKDHIKVIDWAGNILFQGHMDDPQVDIVLDANRCKCSDNSEYCIDCDGTGYSGDFYIKWEDQEDQRNVYEFVNY